jgi:hypothetical protein
MRIGKEGRDAELEAHDSISRAGCVRMCVQVGVMRACEWRVGSWAVGRGVFLLEWSFKVCVRVSVSDAMGLGDVGQWDSVGVDVAFWLWLVLTSGGRRWRSRQSTRVV